MVGIVGHPSPRFDMAAGGSMLPHEWFARVRSVRSAIADLGIRHIVSPRATLNGAKLFAVGIGRKHVEELALWKGLDVDSRAKVERHSGGSL